VHKLVCYETGNVTR